ARLAVTTAGWDARYVANFRRIFHKAGTALSRVHSRPAPTTFAAMRQDAAEAKGEKASE
ncbi:unnamed protein product, partial [Amoebophrya sp. A25]